jgi:hypothetical protein
MNKQSADSWPKAICLYYNYAARYKYFADIPQIFIPGAGFELVVLFCLTLGKLGRRSLYRER